MAEIHITTVKVDPAYAPAKIGDERNYIAECSCGWQQREPLTTSRFIARLRARRHRREHAR